MELITKQEAIQQGKHRFFTGIVCKYGHITERYVSNGLCITCNAMYTNTEHRKNYRHNYYKVYNGVEVNKSRKVAWHFNYKYGLTQEDLKQMRLNQNNCCAICGNEFVGNKTVATAPNVDHDHITNKNRGLLCSKCNRGLGIFNDNKTILENAVKYLALWSNNVT